MGNALCCQCQPRWKKQDGVLCAYVYEECACCRSRKFVLKGADKNDDDWNSYTNSTASKLIEGDVFDSHGVPVAVVHDVPTTCCGSYPKYDVAVEQLQQEWCPNMNSQLQQYGYQVDAFEWVEYRYMHTGQYGGHTQPVPHVCIRVKMLGLDNRNETGGNDNNENASDVVVDKSK